VPFVIDNGGYDHAVATLDDARDECWRRMAEVSAYPLARAAELTAAIQALPETGGTIGPLPDGTTLTVKPVKPEALIAEMGGPEAWPDYNLGDPADVAVILVAYNSR
jgi:hypothetical protein